MNLIRIMIVEDDFVWLRELITFLSKQEDIFVVSTAKTKEEAIQIAKLLDIDVILMDISLSENNFEGIFAISEISQFSKAKIIVLTNYYSEEIITKSFTAGAVNYILKTNFNLIPQVIRACVQGNTPVETLLQDYRNLKKEELLKDLTTAEREIYNLFEQGYRHLHITEFLHKSDSTLKNQIKKILRKLNVKSMDEALEKIKKRGLI